MKLNEGQASLIEQSSRDSGVQAQDPDEAALLCCSPLHPAVSQGTLWKSIKRERENED
jgi:hypothetical protein